MKITPQHIQSLLNEKLESGLSPSVSRSEVVPFDASETKKFLAAVEGDRLGTLFMVAVGVGLRKGEVLGLYWSDIDFERQRLRVRRSLQRIGGQLQFVPPKTDRARRVLGLPAFVVQALRQHRSRQLEEQLHADGSWQDSNLVFTTLMGVTCPPQTGPSVMLVTWTVGRGRNAKEEAYTRAGHQQAA